MLPWGPPACSGLLFPGRQNNLGSCSSQLVFLLGAASPQNQEELGRGKAWGEEGQDCLQHWAELQLLGALTCSFCSLACLTCYDPLLAVGQP